MQLYEFSLFFVLTRLVFPIKHCSVKLLKMEQPFCSQLFFSGLHFFGDNDSSMTTTEILPASEDFSIYLGHV